MLFYRGILQRFSLVFASVPFGFHVMQSTGLAYVFLFRSEFFLPTTRELEY